MSKLWKKGLAIMGFLMAAVFGFAGCGAVEVEEITVLGNEVTFGEWLIAVGIVLLIILAVVAVVAIVKKSGKK